MKTMYTCFTSHEDGLLHGIPEQAQLLYLRGLRRYMDYTTAIVGGAARRISLLMLCELLEVFPHQGMKGSRPDKSKIRRLLGWLERGGLIERVENKDGYLVYFLPHAKSHGWAAAHSSDQNKPDTKPTRSQHTEKPISAAGLNPVEKPSKARKTPKADTHLISNINLIQTTTTTDESDNLAGELADDLTSCGGVEAHVRHSPSPQRAEGDLKQASWEEKLIFPDGLRDGDKKAILFHLKRCDLEKRQAVLDEMAARRSSIRSPSGYVRKLVDCVLSGFFVPEVGIPLAEARERHKKDFQTVSATKRQAMPDSVRAEISRLSSEMVAAQQAGDFRLYSRLGDQVGRLGLG